MSKTEIRADATRIRMFRIFKCDSDIFNVHMLSGLDQNVNRLIKNKGVWNAAVTTAKKQYWREFLTKDKVAGLLKSWRKRCNREGLKQLKT